MFYPDQCPHRIEAPCEATAGGPTAIFTEAETGAVIYTAGTRELDGAEIRQSCPYAIPRKSATTSKAGGMRMAPRSGRDHALLVVADL